MQLSNHGGGCCGSRHLWGIPCSFQYFTANSELSDKDVYEGTPLALKAGFNTLNEEFHNRDLGWGLIDNRRSIEVVLNHPQVEWANFFWLKVLKKSGFKLVNSSFNPNTSNIIYYFHKSVVSPTDAAKTKQQKNIDVWESVTDEGVLT